MKTIQRTNRVSQFAALAVLAAAGLAPSLASANTASNTTVRNTVYVDYADGASVAQPQIFSEVNVVVQLVAATPTVSAPADQTIAPSSTATYSYTVASNANGPDTYNITTPLVESGGLSGSTAAPSTATVTLGATTVAAAIAIPATTNTAVSVPSDSASNANVNQIVAGDTVVMGGVVCSVVSVTDNGTPLTGAITNSSITVNCASPVAATVGMVIGERQSFTVLVDPNGWTPPGPENVTVTTTVQDAANAQAAATDVTITTIEQLLTVTKYVRNVTTPAVGGGSTVTVDGNTYYTTGIIGIPGNTLEYLVEVTNTSSGNNATDTVISDPIPAFTTFVATNFAVINNAGVATAATPAEDNDAGEVQGTTVYLYPGSTVHGDDTDNLSGNPNGDGGTVSAGLKAYGRFQVSID